MFRQNPEKKGQPTDNWHILVANAKGVINHIEDTFDNDLVVGYGELILSPLLLLGSLVKTTIDIVTRKKMAVSELKTTIDKVEKLQEEQFDSFVKKIEVYAPSAKSNSSRKIFTQLSSLEYQNIGERAEYERIKRIMDEKSKPIKLIIPEQVDGLKKECTTVNMSIDIVLSEEAKASAKENAEKGAIKSDKEKRDCQKEKILWFLREPYNAGKKLQHVIKDAVEAVEREASKEKRNTIS